MPLAVEKKKALIEQFRTHEGDTGSPEVQIALLTERINGLTEHFKAHARVRREGTDPGRAVPSVVNVGYRPTFDNEYWIEAYLLDFEGDLYSATLELAFVARLRDERKFPGIEALKSQIARDVESARQAL